MTLVWSILSYIGALVTILFVDLIFTFVSGLLFVPLLRLVRPLYPAFSFVVACAATFFGIWAMAAVAAATPLRASVAMIVIPALLTYRNDRERIRKVHAGVAGPKMLLASHGEVESYNQRADLWNERGYLFGHVFGFALGFSVYFGDQPFW